LQLPDDFVVFAFLSAVFLPWGASARPGREKSYDNPPEFYNTLLASSLYLCFVKNFLKEGRTPPEVPLPLSRKICRIKR
jgi:hypothetical protein